MGTLDPLRARLPWASGISDENPEIAPLTSADLRNLRLPWLSRFNPETLAAHLNENPGKALWVPRTGEYIIAERWRRRDDIANIVEVTARRGKASLVRAILDRLQTQGNSLTLLSDEIWNEQARYYTDLGFRIVETIVFFQRDLPYRVPAATERAPRQKAPSSEDLASLPQLEYSFGQLADLDTLLYLDNNSFPWLWWNSRDELSHYMLTRGVYLYIAYYRNEPVGYASFTMYNGWAHLDRLATVRTFQGRAFGAAQLVHAMDIMVTLGAGSVALSTQSNNVQSHRLYTRYGFRQSRESMRIAGTGEIPDGG